MKMDVVGLGAGRVVSGLLQLGVLAGDGHLLRVVAQDQGVDRELVPHSKNYHYLMVIFHVFFLIIS